ncbi:MAG TPA: thioredoxin domain-containing protein [Methylomirabilota bacterium]|nr:thioredoxin domain-containing protein [Methylomirabilota bacterium]
MSSPTTETAAHRYTNRLAGEKSPYLLQHAHNPVDWLAWGDEAFEKAARENKPIFLSIGYSTCHWCHVMERESFESEETAKFLNEHFVSIKVDREERPDVDKIYMTFVQAMTGSGGWPLNVFITPERKPFFGGTYWPPESKYGRPSFLQVLQQIAGAWQSKKDDILNSAQKLHEQLATMTAREGTNQILPGKVTLQNAGLHLKHGYDELNGGWGSAPKFPSPSHPRFLLRYGARFEDGEAVRMVLHTCDQMAAGGIYDQLGGGFSRYSVDAQWLVPHFEKMLYDNAQLVQLYLDAYLISGEQRYADVVRDVLRYVLRDMTHPEGGFYSAEDADSEGKEGKFYAWTTAELKQLLTPGEYEVATNYFGVTPVGNFVDHSDPNPLPDQNVLSIANPDALKPTVGQAPPPAEILASAKRKMFDARAKRVRPGLDDKILASWNGLMLGAIARAGIVLGEERYLAATEKNVAFLRSKLWDANTKTLYHRWRDGQRDNTQLLESYAFLLDGVIDLYEATLKPEHLEFAIALAESMLARFYDAKDGGFWQSTGEAKDLILRVKDDYDGAEPSGNAVAAMSLLRLAAISERKEFKDAGERTIRLFSDRLQQLPQAVAFMLAAFDFSSEEPRRAVIAGDPAAAESKRLVRAAHSLYQPRKVVLGTSGPVEKFAKTLEPKDGQPTAYVCTGTACQPPTHDDAKLKSQLR